MREDDFIVSKTELKGRISYCNRIFVEFSGYTAAELLGAQHNIARHPDMPRGVFKVLWDTPEQRRECFAYAKNMAKDGSFYWVLANITPNIDAQGQVLGYFSVRRKPAPGAVSAVSDLCRRMREEECGAGPKQACAASIALLGEVLHRQQVSYDEFMLSL